MHPPLSSKSHWPWLGVLPLLCCGACSSSSLNPVEGTVLYKDQPLEGVLVSFHPEADDLHAQPSTALTGAGGVFSLTTAAQSGAPAGAYRVTFVCYVDAASGQNQLVDRLKEAYARKSASQFRIEVKPGKNELAAFHLH